MDNVSIRLFILHQKLTHCAPRAVSFEACCQWALLHAQITRLATLPYYLLCRSTCIHLSVKCMLGLFVFP